MAATEKQKRNLKPIQKGQKLNPQGINQYTGSRGKLYKAIQESLTRFGPDAVRRAYQLAAKGGKTSEGATERMALATLLADDVVDKVYEWENAGLARDLDFQSYRIHRMVFDEQQAVLTSKKPIKCVICGRRAGKTTDFAALAWDRSIHHEKGAAVYIGRTMKSAFDLIWPPLMKIGKELGIEFTPHLATQTVELSTGVEIMIRGRDNRKHIEDLRGKGYFLAIIDETQGDEPEFLKMLVKEILEPAGKDFVDAEIVLGGTPSRIPGNYADELFLGLDKNIGRFNWNLSVNPHIPKEERDLEATRVKKGFRPEDPVWQREYMGKVGAYDVEALVFRIGAGNRFVETDLANWISLQVLTDIFFVGGLDYGFEDYDSAVIVMASESRPERYLLAEYKGHRQSTSDFGNEIKLLMKKVLENPILGRLPNRRIPWFCDTEGLGKQLTFDLAKMYNITVQPAYQGQPDLMVEMLQDDIDQGRFKVHEKQTVGGVEVVGPFEEECRKILFARDDQDHLTRRIDDDLFHPEIAKSVLYAMRYVFMKSRIKPGGGRFS